MSFCNPGRRFNKTAYSVLETLVDAGCLGFTLISTKLRISFQSPIYSLQIISIPVIKFSASFDARLCVCRVQR